MLQCNPDLLAAFMEALMRPIHHIIWGIANFDACNAGFKMCMREHLHQILNENPHLMDEVVQNEKTKKALRSIHGSYEYLLDKYKDACVYGCAYKMNRKCSAVCSPGYYSTAKADYDKKREETRRDREEKERKEREEREEQERRDEEKRKQEEERIQEENRKEEEKLKQEQHHGLGWHCCSDNDCPGSLWCYHGRCDKMSGYGEDCKSHDHCWDPYSCVGGVCQ